MSQQNTSASDLSRSDTASPSFDEVLRTWARIGVMSFGGPAAQIALMHRIIVDEKKWLSEPQYLNALSFCMLLPGPEAMQLATYAGWRLHGLAGGLAAGLLFVLPGAAIVLALAMIYAAFGHVPMVEAVFFGIKAAVLVIVIEALQRISKRALTTRAHWVIAGLSFIAIFFLALPFPLIVLAAAVYGFFSASGPVSPVADPAQMSSSLTTASLADTVRTAGLWLAIWIAPLAALAVALGREHVVTQLAWFFSKLAVVSFGGAYALLAYMGQDVVVHYGWLSAGQMMDGLGLAETTPGPLILVTEFVGYLAAYQNGGGPALVMGLLGALVALWATFAPSFLWIFAGAPYLDWIIGQPRLRGALAGITAAVVGVILNLALWFGLHVFFKEVTLIHAGWLRLWTPTVSSLDWPTVVVAAISGFLLLRRQWDIGRVLVVASLLGVAIRFAGL